MKILAKYKDGYYYKATIIRKYSKYLYYIKWDHKTSNDRLKYYIFSKNNNKYKLIDYILISFRRNLINFIN